MKRTAIYILILIQALASTLFISGCVSDKEPAVSDDFEEGIPTEVKFMLSSRFNAAGSRANADGMPVDPVCDNEKIQDWFMVFVDKTGKVAKIVSRSDEETGITVSQTDAFEQETFRCILPSGTYSVYAFANMTKDELSKAIGMSLKEGNKIVTGDIEGKDWSTELNKWDIDQKPIPMTGFLKNLQVKNTIEETFSIEVVRMLAKVEFQFSNEGDESVAIKSVSLDPVTTSDISLFPRNSDGIGYSHLGNSAYEALTGATYDMVTQNFASPLIVAAKTDESAATKSVALYVKEAISKRYNDDAFTVGINVTHNNGISEHQQYNITKDIKGYINRNDWIVIPITLSRYDVSVEALFYPPIGGYPAVLSSTDPDGSQIFTFGTDGEFAIVPHVFDKVTGKHLSPSDYTIKIGAISGITSLFSEGPSIPTTSSSLPAEITGKFSTAKGKVSVEIVIEIGSQTYRRTIYIIRPN